MMRKMTKTVVRWSWLLSTCGWKDIRFIVYCDDMELEQVEEIIHTMGRKTKVSSRWRRHSPIDLHPQGRETTLTSKDLIHGGTFTFQKTGSSGCRTWAKHILAREFCLRLMMEASSTSTSSSSTPSSTNNENGNGISDINAAQKAVLLASTPLPDSMPCIQG